MIEATYIRKKILKWYAQNGRDFPWRHTDDPYKIMIAEFMLHRTKAEQVVPVYNNFIEHYPDIFSLSKASEKEIKKYTQNLGLHWRYKHFVNASKYIQEKYKGKFPCDFKELRKVPGIGEYISCAISIISFKIPAPVVDSNIARFLNRLYGLNLSGEIRRKKEIFHTKKCDILLFSLIDFCAEICKPVIPLCSGCIIKEYCKFNIDK